MFDVIVVGTDGSSRSRQAVMAAAALARIHDAKLHLVRAFRTTLQSAAIAEPVMSLGPATDAEVHEQVSEELRRLASEIERDGVAVQTYVCPGGAASAILSVAEAQSADVIVVGSRGMQGARRVLGSVRTLLLTRPRARS